jgi:hypothetical protein
MARGSHIMFEKNYHQNAKKTYFQKISIKKLKCEHILFQESAFLRPFQIFMTSTAEHRSFKITDQLTS